MSMESYMEEPAKQYDRKALKKLKHTAFKDGLFRGRQLYLIGLIPVVWFIIFKYLPLVNAQIAFKDFMPDLGVWDSPWVGFDNFVTFINGFYFAELMRNTLFYSFAKLAVGMPMAILLAITLYETSIKWFRRAVQTTTYLPHFLSWIIIFGILIALLSPGDGLINELIRNAGGKPIAFLTEPNWFPFIIIFSDMWKEMGWSAIIFMAALLAIDPALYEAAEVEGASRLQRIRYITLPGMMEVIVVVLLLRLGTVLDAGFYQIFALYSAPVYSVSDILDTWVYRSGLLDFQFSLATAVGLFKGVIGATLLFTANRLAKRFASSSLY